MKIFLTHAACRGNKGDAAIVSSMIIELRRQFPQAEFVLETLDFFNSGETFDLIPQVHSFFYFAIFESKNFIMRYLRTVWVVLITLVWSLVFRFSSIRLNFLLSDTLKITLNLYADADLIIPIGGGYLTVKSGIRNTGILFLRILPIFVGAILKKPIIFYSQSIGPFANRIQEFIAWLAIKQARALFVRESISEKMLLKKGYPTDKLFVMPDAAFLFQAVEDKVPNYLLNDKLLVGITVRLWFDSKKQEDFEIQIAEFAKYLVRNNYCVVFISQVDCINHKNDDDREVVKKIQKLIGPIESVIYMYDKTDHLYIKNIYSKLFALIGTRMHSNIFALTSYVPALAIAYEYKTTGIMNDLGLDEWVVDINGIKAEVLKNKFDELLNRKEEYLSKLRINLPPYILRAKQTAPKLKEIYQDLLT